MNKNRGVLQQLFRVLLGVVLCDLLMLAVRTLCGADDPMMLEQVEEALRSAGC